MWIPKYLLEFLIGICQKKSLLHLKPAPVGICLFKKKKKKRKWYHLPAELSEILSQKWKFLLGQDLVRYIVLIIHWPAKTKKERFNTHGRTTRRE